MNYLLYCHIPKFLKPWDKVERVNKIPILQSDATRIQSPKVIPKKTQKEVEEETKLHNYEVFKEEQKRARKEQQDKQDKIKEQAKKEQEYLKLRAKYELEDTKPLGKSVVEFFGYGVPGVGTYLFARDAGNNFSRSWDLFKNGYYRPALGNALLGIANTSFGVTSLIPAVGGLEYYGKQALTGFNRIKNLAALGRELIKGNLKLNNLKATTPTDLTTHNLFVADPRTVSIVYDTSKGIPTAPDPVAAFQGWRHQNPTLILDPASPNGSFSIDRSTFNEDLTGLVIAKIPQTSKNRVVGHMMVNRLYGLGINPKTTQGLRFRDSDAFKLNPLNDSPAIYKPYDLIMEDILNQKPKLVFPTSDWGHIGGFAGRQTWRTFDGKLHGFEDPIIRALPRRSGKPAELTLLHEGVMHPSEYSVLRLHSSNLPKSFGNATTIAEAYSKVSNPIDIIDQSILLLLHINRHSLLPNEARAINGEILHWLINTIEKKGISLNSIETNPTIVNNIIENHFGGKANRQNLITLLSSLDNQYTADYAKILSTSLISEETKLLYQQRIVDMLKYLPSVVAGLSVYGVSSDSFQSKPM